MRQTDYTKRYYLVLLLMLLISACSVKDGAPKMTYEQWDQIPDALPEPVVPSPYGNPDSYSINGITYHVMDSAEGFSESGIASWYGTKFHGRRTSSGETYDMHAMTAAHKTLPIPVYVEVVNLENDRRIIVRVNDRGPFHEGRVIDLSYAAASKLGVSEKGTAKVKIRVITEQGEDPESLNAAYTDDEGKVFVQVASYGSEDNAFGLIKKLHAKNFSDIRIHVDNTNGDFLYQVRIGPLPSSQVAQKLVTKLKDIKYYNAKIINYL